MLKAFRTNTPVQLAVILATILALWLPALITPVPMPQTHSFAPLYTLLAGWLAPVPHLSAALALVLVAGSALYFNKQVTEAQLVSNSTLLPTLLYILAMSMCPGGLTLTPLVLVNALLAVCTKLLMLKGSLLTIQPEKTFGIMALVGICTLIYMPALSLLISFLLIVIVYRLYNWRDWMVTLLGFLAPYILFATYLYLTDGLADTWHQLLADASSLGLHIMPCGTATSIANGYMVLLLVVAMFGTMIIINERTVVVQKSVTAVSLLMVAGAIMLCYSQLFPADMQVMALPFALQTTIFLQNMERSKRPWIWDIVLLLTIASAIAYNYL